MFRKLAIAIVLAIICLPLSIFGYGRFVNRTPSPIPFDSQRWKETTKWEFRGESLRHAMLDDLCRNHLEAGMTRQTIIDLLGKPRIESTRRVSFFVCQIWSVSSIHGRRYLELRFNEDDKLTLFDVVPG